MTGTLRYLLCGIVALTGANAAPVQDDTSARIFEAEDALLTGTNIDTAQAGFTGTDTSPGLLGGGELTVIN